MPGGEYTIPFGVADVKRAGDDVTIVATSSMVRVALAAADQLEAQGISAEVIDPRTLAPLDEEELWRGERDPLALHGGWLTEQNFATADALEAIAAGAREEIAQGVSFALDAPFPDPGRVTDDVYA